MITSLFVSIIDANIFHQSHFFLLLTAGGISLYWLLSHFLTLHKEIKILKEEHQYFMDSFQSIRNPITLVHTPLRAACDDSSTPNRWILPNMNWETSLITESIH